MGSWKDAVHQQLFFNYLNDTGCGSKQNKERTTLSSHSFLSSTRQMHQPQSPSPFFFTATKEAWSLEYAYFKGLQSHLALGFLDEKMRVCLYVCKYVSLSASTLLSMCIGTYICVRESA